MVSACHPLHRLLAVVIVGEDGSNVDHVVLIFIGRHVLERLAEVVVGFVYLPFGNEDFASAVGVVGRVLVDDLPEQLFCFAEVLVVECFVNLVGERCYGAGRQAQREVDGIISLVGIAGHLVIVGNVRQFFGVQEYWLPRTDGILVFSEQFAELVAVVVFVARIVHWRWVISSRCPSNQPSC